MSREWLYKVLLRVRDPVNVKCLPDRLSLIHSSFYNYSSAVIHFDKQIKLNMPNMLHCTDSYSYRESIMGFALISSYIFHYGLLLLLLTEHISILMIHLKYYVEICDIILDTLLFSHSV